MTSAIVELAVGANIGSEPTYYFDRLHFFERPHGCVDDIGNILGGVCVKVFVYCGQTHKRKVNRMLPEQSIQH